MSSSFLIFSIKNIACWITVFAFSSQIINFYVLFFNRFLNKLGINTEKVKQQEQNKTINVLSRW